MHPLAYLLLGLALIYLVGGLCLVEACRKAGEDIDEDRK